MSKHHQPADVYSAGVPANVALPFQPADFDPGNGAGLYVSPQFDRSIQEPDPWRDVTDELKLPPWFTLSDDFKPIAPGQRPEVGPTDDGLATRYLEGVGWWPQDEFRPIWDFYTYEIASIYVPRGCFGVCHRIDTHVAAYGEGRTIVIYNTPLDPWKFQRDFKGRYLAFQLRLERPRIVPVQGPWQGFGQATLPGVPHPDLGGWNDLRYAWGNDNFALRLLIPEDNWLRLYVSVPGHDVFPPPPVVSDTIAEIGGRLVGVVANYRDNARALDTARRGW